MKYRFDNFSKNFIWLYEQFFNHEFFKLFPKIMRSECLFTWKTISKFRMWFHKELLWFEVMWKKKPWAVSTSLLDEFFEIVFERRKTLEFYYCQCTNWQWFYQKFISRNQVLRSNFHTNHQLLNIHTFNWFQMISK